MAHANKNLEKHMSGGFIVGSDLDSHERAELERAQSMAVTITPRQRRPSFKIEESSTLSEDPTM